MLMGPQGGPSSRTLYADITLLQVSARGEDCFTGTQKRKKSPAAVGRCPSAALSYELAPIQRIQPTPRNPRVKQLTRPNEIVR